MMSSPDAPPVIFAAATSAEARAIAPIAGLLQTGMGAANATRSINAELARGAASGVVSIGTATGLNPELPTGSLLLPVEVRWLDGRTRPVHRAWHDRVSTALRLGAPVTTEPLLSVDELLFRPERKAELKSISGAAAADMESGALAEAAHSAGLPFLAIRVVLDTAGEAMPRAAASGVDADGNLNLGPLLIALLQRPGEFAGLIRLMRGFRHASRILASACAVAEPLLHASEHSPDSTVGNSGPV